MCPIDSGLYCPKRSQLLKKEREKEKKREREKSAAHCILGPCVLSFSDVNRLMSLIKFGSKIGHWNPQWKLRKEDTRKCLFFGESSWCWISNFSSSCFLFLHSTFFPDRIQTTGFVEEEMACQCGKFTLCLAYLNWCSWNLSSSPKNDSVT